MKNELQTEANRETALNARPWKTTLRLTRMHWNRVEDVVDRVRRTGARYRPGSSVIVSGILDATLPALIVADWSTLRVERELDEEQTKTKVREWIAEWLRSHLPASNEG